MNYENLTLVKSRYLFFFFIKALTTKVLFPIIGLQITLLTTVIYIYVYIMRLNITDNSTEFYDSNVRMRTSWNKK